MLPMASLFLGTGPEAESLAVEVVPYGNRRIRPRPWRGRVVRVRRGSDGDSPPRKARRGRVVADGWRLIAAPPGGREAGGGRMPLGVRGDGQSHRGAGAVDRRLPRWSRLDQGLSVLGSAQRDERCIRRGWRSHRSRTPEADGQTQKYRAATGTTRLGRPWTAKGCRPREQPCRRPEDCCRRLWQISSQFAPQWRRGLQRRARAPGRPWSEGPLCAAGDSNGPLTETRSKCRCAAYT